MPQIRHRMPRQQAEENDDRLSKRIPHCDRRVESRIVQRSLRPAHPIHDASPVWIDRSSAAHNHARISGELLDRRQVINPSRAEGG